MWRGPSGIPVLSAAKHSAGFAKERKTRQPERIDGARRAWRLLRLLHLVSTIALMKELHQKKTGYSGANGVYHPCLPPEQILDYAPCFGTMLHKSGTMLHTSGL